MEEVVAEMQAMRVQLAQQSAVIASLNARVVEKEEVATFSSKAVCR